jgi:signal peptidase I
VTAVKKPNKWVAGILALMFSPFVGLLYAAKLRWAFVYFIVLAGAAADFLWWGGSSFVALLFPLITLTGVAHAFLAAARYPVGLHRPIYSKWHGLLGILFLLFTLLVLVRAFLFEPFRVASGSMLPTLEVGKHVIASKWGYGNNSAYGITIRKGEIGAPVTRGDVMVFVFPASNERLEYLMRVVGLPGDLIEYKAKSLSINGQPAIYHDLGTYDYVTHAGDLVSANSRSESIGTATYRVLNAPDMPAIFIGNISDFPSKAHCIYRSDGFACRVPDKHYYMLGDNRDASNDSRYWGFVPQDHIVGKVINLQP